ncbi:MAG: membrane protein [Methyloligella sp.]|jgi:cytochrome c biogenesis protein CcmG/thiol:disulfide interchange protein DsbE|nr:MAG: membrane protein [Methyloligella sp.]
MTTHPQTTKAQKAETQKTVAWWQFALIGVMIMMFILFAAGLGRDSKFIPSPLIGKPAYDFNLKQLGAEKQIKLSDYKGKIVVLNFWASWCVTCREEHHVLLESSKAVQPSGKVQFIGVNSKDTDKAAFGFMDKRGHFPYPSVIDRQGRLALEYGVYGMPETFFINKNGVIAAKHIGALTHKILADKLKQAEALQ